MALLLGQEAEGAGAEEATVAELGTAVKFKALATGKVTALHVTFSANGTGTSGRLALQADEAGKPKEGVLCEGPIASVTAGAHETTSLTAEPEITSGTEYWLTVIALGGNSKLKPGATTSRAKTTVKHPLISEIKTADWAAATAKGPSSLWATGTESSTKVEGKASGTLLLTGSAKGTAANVVSGKASGPLLLTGTAKGTVANVVAGKASGALLLTGTAKGTAANVVAGKASGALLLTGSAKGTLTEGSVVKGKASGAILLTGAAKGIVVSLVKGKAAGTLTLMGKATGTSSAVVVGKASGRLALTGTGTGTLRAVVLGAATGTLRLTGAATATGGGAVVISHPGLVSPSSAAGRSSPMTLAGLVRPRPGHVVAGLRPNPGLYPKTGLWPRGDTIVPD